MENVYITVINSENISNRQIDKIVKQEIIFFIYHKKYQNHSLEVEKSAIFFDIASAFDKVWHNGLIYKLVEMKLPLYLVN